MATTKTRKKVPTSTDAKEKRLVLVKSRLHPVVDARVLLHMLVWGRVKSGKTTFACSGPKPIMFLAETGQLSVRTHKDLVIYPLNPDGSFRKVIWKDAYDFLYLLRHGGLERETVVIDTASALVRIGMKYILKDEEARDVEREPDTPTQPTWNRLTNIMLEFMEELEAICRTQNMHLIYTAQQRILSEQKAETEGTNISPDFSPALKSFITQKPDILARTFIEKEESDDLEAEPTLKYGMMFRHDEFLVGERVTPRGAKTPYLPSRAFDVTIPGLIRVIEKERKAANG